MDEDEFTLLKNGIQIIDLHLTKQTEILQEILEKLRDIDSQIPIGGFKN